MRRLPHQRTKYGALRMKTIQMLKSLFLMGFLLQATTCHAKASKKHAPNTNTAKAAVPIGTTIEQTNPAHSAFPVEAAIRRGTTVELTIMGFNYTDQDINEFFVDGSGGGNLSVSSASGGGGGSVCCAIHTAGHPAPEVKVRWQSDACTYNIRYDVDGTEFNDIYSIYSTAKAKIAPVSANPKYLEIHIFPDGHVEAAITSEIGRPRLALDQNRRINVPFRKCPNGKKPA